MTTAIVPWLWMHGCVSIRGGGEVCGVVVEDFGDMAGHAVDIGENQFVGPARRWAVALDAGSLVFVDSDQLVVEEL